jgi:hypothetical protein
VNEERAVETAAWHEAGHAVMRWLRRVPATQPMLTILLLVRREHDPGAHPHGGPDHGGNVRTREVTDIIAPPTIETLKAEVKRLGMLR